MEIPNKILLVALVGGTLGYYYYKNQSSEVYRRQVNAAASAYDRAATSALASDSAMTANYLKLISALHDFREERAQGRTEATERDFLGDALTKAGLTSDMEIYLIAGGAIENLDICIKAGVFEDADQVRRLNEGTLPQVCAGPYKGEPFVFARRVGVQFARGAANHPANLRLTPESAADMIWPYTVTDYVLKAANELRPVGLVSEHELSDLRRRNNERRALEFR